MESKISQLLSGETLLPISILKHFTTWFPMQSLLIIWYLMIITAWKHLLTNQSLLKSHIHRGRDVYYQYDNCLVLDHSRRPKCLFFFHGEADAGVPISPYVNFIFLVQITTARSSSWKANVSAGHLELALVTSLCLRCGGANEVLLT